MVGCGSELNADAAERGFSVFLRQIVAETRRDFRRGKIRRRHEAHEVDAARVDGEIEPPFFADLAGNADTHAERHFSIVARRDPDFAFDDLVRRFRFDQASARAVVANQQGPVARAGAHDRDTAGRSR